MSTDKFAVMSLSVKTPMMIRAVLKDGVLVISETTPLPASGREQKEKLPEVIAKLRNAGFIVLVDEPVPFVSMATGAQNVTLKSRHSDGRPVIVVGMERYADLSGRKLLSLPEGAGGRFSIPDSIVDTEYNLKGEEIYRINWPELRPEHVILIIACYATLQNNVASDDYIAAMDKAFGLEEAEKAVDSSLRTLARHEVEKAAEMTKETLTGKDYGKDKDTFIL